MKKKIGVIIAFVFLCCTTVAMTVLFFTEKNNKTKIIDEKNKIENEKSLLESEKQSNSNLNESLIADNNKIKSDNQKLNNEIAELKNHTTPETEAPKQTIDWKEDTYSTDITFEMLAREPDKYKAARVEMTGTIVQVVEDSQGTVNLRVNINDDYNQTVFCGFYSDILEKRVLENDKIRFWGVSNGVISYTSTMGACITLPGIWIRHLEIIN